MADIFSSDKRSLIMSRVKSKGNESTELALIALMRARSIKGWRRGVKLVGSPDFVFPLSRVAVFVDGDFWHSNPKTFKVPQTNSTFWYDKIAKNWRRDLRVSRALREMGWRVIRIKESRLKRYPDLQISRLESLLNSFPLAHKSGKRRKKLSLYT